MHRGCMLATSGVTPSLLSMEAEVLRAALGQRFGWRVDEDGFYDSDPTDELSGRQALDPRVGSKLNMVV